jgi:hypothetical protein
MKSEHIKDKLERYIDRELNASEQKHVEDHIAACPDCAAELARLRSLHTAGASNFIPEPPSGYWNRLSRDISGKIAELEPQRKKAPDRFTAIRRWIWPEKIGYRFIGLATTAVLVFFIVRIVQFQKTQLPLPSRSGDKEKYTVDGVVLRPAEESEHMDGKTLSENTSSQKAAVPASESRAMNGGRTAPLTKTEKIAEPPIQEKTASIGAVADKDERIGVAVDEVIVLEQPAKQTEQGIKQKPPGVSLATQDYAAKRARTYEEPKEPYFIYTTAGKETISDTELNAMIQKAVQGPQAVKAQEAEMEPEDALLINRLYEMVQNTQNEDHILEILENNLENEKDQSLHEAMVRLAAEIHFTRAIRTRIRVHINRALEFYQEHEATLKAQSNYSQKADSLKIVLQNTQ